MPVSQTNWLTPALAHLQHHGAGPARVGIILGSGLGGFAAEIEAETTLPYSQIPGFPVSTAIGHKGQLTLGRFAGLPVAVLEGRFHLYEGYTADQVIRPIQLLQALGIELLIVTNAAGGLRPGLRVGDVVVVEDHVNLMWTGPNVFPSTGRAKLPLSHDLRPMNEGSQDSEGASPSPSLYDLELAAWAIDAAREAGTNSPRGVYIGMTGPNYETRAEYRWLRQVGDLVGMSTIPEVLAARSLGIRVLALSVVSNECNPDALEPTDGAHVVAAVSQAEGRLRSMVHTVLSRWQVE